MPVFKKRWKKESFIVFHGSFFVCKLSIWVTFEEIITLMWYLHFDVMPQDKRLAEVLNEIDN